MEIAYDGLRQRILDGVYSPGYTLIVNLG